MDVLVVLAHPVPESFSHAIARTAVDALEAKGHTVHFVDLYAVGFRAAMSKEERTAYHSGQPVLDPLVEEHTGYVRASDALVLVYPTWWSGMPAIMKGWLERVMLPGVAFGFDAKGKVRPAMQHIRHLVGISTYGSPWPYVKFVNDNGRRTLMRTIRLNTGMRTRRTWLGFYAIDTSTPARRAAFLARVARTMGAL